MQAQWNVIFFICFRIAISRWWECGQKRPYRPLTMRPITVKVVHYVVESRKRLIDTPIRFLNLNDNKPLEREWNDQRSGNLVGYYSDTMDQTVHDSKLPISNYELLQSDYEAIYDQDHAYGFNTHSTTPTQEYPIIKASFAEYRQEFFQFNRNYHCRFPWNPNPTDQRLCSWWHAVVTTYLADYLD